MEGKFYGHAGKLKGEDAWLLKPTTFMNNSGRSVGALAKFYKLAPESVLVIHDELDLPQLGTPNFWRLRLGIGHPGDRNAVVNFVLHAPSRDELQAVEHNIDQSLAVLPLLLAGKFEDAMLKLHTKAQSQAPSKVLPSVIKP